MAPVDLSDGIDTPIAQLGPDLPNQKSRVVRGAVTITWPYSSVRRSSAFLLAESDVRLRRSKGQVRVQLHGSSAQAIVDCGLGGGDEVVLSLDGAGWVEDDSTSRPQGSLANWQLKFSEKLLIQVTGPSPEAPPPY